MTTPTTNPAATFESLSDAESRALLHRHRVGRIAFAFHDRVDIEPIHYTLDGDWIFGRTSVGAKLSTLAHHPWCAFEVDEVQGMVDWISVVAKGSFHLLDPETGSPDLYARAYSKVRTLLPSAFTTNDPAPHRIILFGVHVKELTGRSARSLDQW